MRESFIQKKKSAFSARQFPNHLSLRQEPTLHASRSMTCAAANPPLRMRECLGMPTAFEEFRMWQAMGNWIWAWGRKKRTKKYSILRFVRGRYDVEREFGSSFYTHMCKKHLLLDFPPLMDTVIKNHFMFYLKELRAELQSSIGWYMDLIALKKRVSEVHSRNLKRGMALFWEKDISIFLFSIHFTEE